MRRELLFILAVSAFVFGRASGATVAADPTNPYYCPPGSKFCPAPGADNTLAIDTHFGVDAQTGEVTAYRGTVHPNEVNNPPMTGEQVLYTAPPINVENRYVPYPGSPQTNMDATTAYLAQPQYAPQPQYMAQPQPNYAQYPLQSQYVTRQPYPQQHNAQVPQQMPMQNYDSRPRQTNTASEVANQQTARDDRRVKTHNGEKVPWYKGGLWRNKKDKDDPGGNDSSTTTASAPGRSQSDLWDDEEYTGYNPDGSFGRQNSQQRAQPDSNYYAQQSRDNFGNGAYGNPYPQQQQYSQPYPQPYSDPYGQSGPPTANYAGDPYTLPNSPGPSSPYQPGYTYPGTDISYESTYQGGYPQQLHAQQSQYMIAPPQEVTDPFMSAAPSATTIQAPSEAEGSPQFQNAVRMVKENRFNEAKSILASETNRNPGNAAAWRWLADCHYNLLELDEAINSYQRALNSDPNDYYALRGQGFAYLHRGHEYWRRMQEEVSMGQKEQAAATFAQAHDNYKKSLELLGMCLRRAPNDGEAIYGEAMAAEGASRKLYSNAISFLKLGPEQRGRAELFAENCLTVINKGIERSKERARQSAGDAGPRALLAGLYLRKAILYHSLGKNDLALMELKNSRDVQQSILDEIDKNNATAQKNIKECEAYWEEWGGNKQ